MSKKCSECDYAICADYGYSNYTVEGTTVYCSLKLNPHGEFDQWYGEDFRGKYAESCDEYSNTEGPSFVDCDREDVRGEYADPNSWVEYATAKVPAEKLVEILT